jgi:hypothetical protein
MAGKEKRMAAALAAVNAYIQHEEETACAQQLAATLAAPPPAAQLNIWGMSGRQEMMAMRRLIQMRAFDRFR